MGSKFHDDEYVANLLKQDAKDATKKYELVGIDAFNPKRCVANLFDIRSCLNNTSTFALCHFLYATDISQGEIRRAKAEHGIFKTPYPSDRQSQRGAARKGS